ncbi:tryptophan synthase subunit alpha [Rossellomorea aquimaris]|uniref:tryptophan synthase subunit alpha n=1 Tax=Rossellomorea aquimaris TaxID=189382 RepID=UPI001CD6904D|nr:tryptophan synthase subunit alpha [Rossellomorea aquimaris]MCA1054466.1 tryptophan synthase subunit alpha [Rossellomorea aquimaris]
MGKDFMEQAFQKELNKGNKLFIPYIMAGDGGIDGLIDSLKLLEESGATAIEIGIPFSDPVADGPTIQRAGKRALENGVSLQYVLDELAGRRGEIGIPLVFMTYINPLYKYGIERFFSRCEEVGVDGVIIPDLPAEHRDLIASPAEEHGIAIIQLATLTSSEERIRELAALTEGFLYAVTINGTTGARSAVNENIGNHLQVLKRYSQVPVLAGFGISTPEHVREMTRDCDGVIVGSRIIDLLQEENVSSIKELMDAAKMSSPIKL